MIYLDHAATSPVRREVLEAMWPFLTQEYGNPSSSHALGGSASRALDQARERVARFLGGRASETLFTSGGTESINTAVKGLALGAPRGRHLVISAIEHEATVESADHLRRLHGFTVSVAPVDAHGRVDAEELSALVRADTTLVSVMAANNEIGTVQDIPAIAVLCRERGVPLHVDAVQAAGWIDASAFAADAVSISGHKLGAPKGVGALLLRRRLPFEPLVHGGGQERERRSGTENVAFAVALGVAVGLVEPARAARVGAVRDEFCARVAALTPRAMAVGSLEHRLPSIAAFVVPGRSGESVLLALEERGIVVSSGSACAAGRDEPSPTLLALGLAPELAQTAVRFSFGEGSTLEEARAAAEAFAAVLA
ncbi:MULTISPECIES: cysteine desulfurase family protein [unclassified Rathayibacter]|uniref:cysteine desulfurase family protein n=1 Tax=unclassified Rathayibacter TaxID=2609250 RepID=UPI00188CEF89|nr:MULTISPECIES: cysteine desulfurase family protein [unclassified Rathayibacter]MBF4463466.1 cysteine desulfurase [Rathayibacter sp. VKM Ac-2879]MBF4504812.1 cysteine desulfurase [Rathayibacter sp. VKM Ac-2878]